ncbi:hypothetical protein VTK73DRAFT_9413 [Phialemonium thermophilum]|uniref:Mandelate racemase/muconate lactonizing enzyme C-terminal domain-containing protein n=1 Tax=Phialemonium thermophilum TaxID=223376 RepID=A0ABR3W2F9_9PEZI
MAPAQHTIRSVTPILADKFLFVKIETDTGIAGYGEAGIWSQTHVALSVVERFTDYLIGKNAFDIEHHWNALHRFSYFQGLAINSGISAIDIALWDIKGKALGVPIFELLGGACRTKARVYPHVRGKTLDALLQDAQWKVKQGFNAIGHLNPFLDEDKDTAYFKTHVRKMEDAIENVRKVREAVGPDVDIALELHRRLSPTEAITFCNGVESYRPLFIEDPIRPENPGAMARVAKKITLPIATGERLCTLYEFHALFKQEGLEYARVDPALCGGITGMKKVAAIAEAYHVQLVPHNPLSPIGLAACLQVVAAIPNFLIQEYTTALDAESHSEISEHVGANLVDYVPVPEGGFVKIPDRPGLGINLLDDAPTISPPVVLPIKVRKHYDGFIVDQ